MMILRKNKTTWYIKVSCPHCGSDDVQYWMFNKGSKITSESKVRCNKCFEVHKLTECKQEAIYVPGKEK